MARLTDRYKTQNRQPEGSLPPPPVENVMVRIKKPRVAVFARFV